MKFEIGDSVIVKQRCGKKHFRAVVVGNEIKEHPDCYEVCGLLQGCATEHKGNLIYNPGMLEKISNLLDQRQINRKD